MDETITKACSILDQYEGDNLVPLDAIKQCIGLLEQNSDAYSKHIELLRSQIGVLGSDDTSLFSAQLVASKLRKALLSI